MTLAACAALVERGDPDRFAATMAAPPAARARLFPLYAFNLEVARAPWVTKEPMIAEMRLQWWRDAVEEIAAGKPVRAHEVVAPLAETLSGAGVPVGDLAEALDRGIEARRWDIYRDPFEDGAALDAYLDATAGGLMWAAGAALGAQPGQEAALRDAGWAAGLAAFLRAVPELEARGRVPLVDGRPEAVAALAREGLARWTRARAARLPRALHPALWSGWQTAGLLRLALAEPGRVAEGKLSLSEFARRGGLARRALLGGW